MDKHPFLLGITGASGALYALRLAKHLKEAGESVHAVVSDPGKKVIAYEGQDEIWKYLDKVYGSLDFFAPIASGSFRIQGMVVLPCSMATLGKMAHGIGDTLLTRAADVTLKEKRKLIIVPREAPMTAIHFQNQKILAAAHCRCSAAAFQPNCLS
jgi:4-hydroxy-3-polyprenylbenzoate decarboxylase